MVSPAKEGGKKTPGRRKTAKASDLERPEIEAVACDYFCHEGLTAPQIQVRIKEEHGVDITREEAYRYVRKAAKAGCIRYTPPQGHLLHGKIKQQRYPWIQDVSVVQTATCDGVAARGAQMLLELIQQHYSGREEVHVGFSGGAGLRTLASVFAELLRGQPDHMPKRIIFHAMVAGFDMHEPTTDPNAFFAYFVKDPSMQVETSFVALHAPAMVRPSLLVELTKQPGIRESYERAHEIDIIVTGASCWNDEHSPLRRYMQVAEEPLVALEKAGCVGDFLWQPVGNDGPIEMKTALKAMTLMQLDEVGDFIKQKKHVLLVAGPCNRCHKPKTEVVHAILNQDPQLITHLAIDSRCARDLLAL